VLIVVFCCIIFNRYLRNSKRSGYGSTGECNTLTASMGIYPNDETTSSAPGGFVEMEFDESSGDIGIEMNLFGMAPDCSTTNTEVNGCGVHIHAGIVCNDNDEIAGHYWTPSSDLDPWQEARYDSNAKGRVDMEIHIPGGNGYSLEENEMHSVVVHDATGARISCGILYKQYDY
jgi:hypothetical protein